MLATLDDRLKIDVTNATPSNEAVSFEALMGAQAQPAPAVRVPPQFEHAAASDTLPDLFDFLAPAPVAPVTQPDHVPAQQHDFRAPTPPTAQPAGDAPAPMIPEDWDLPGIAQPALPAPVEAPAPAASAPAPTANDDLMQAFLRGAGLDHLRIDTAQAAAQMGSLGRSYRLMVEGLIDVLRARASLKGEFRMQQTLIQPLENNPLKFAPNADEALLLLLRHGNQAFMAPDQAIADSFEDLRAHQLAVMAGVQAAIGHLLKRFEPAALEARLDSPGGLAALLAGSRQARYWQQFTELYQQIANEAEDDFQDLFGREFSRAYEEHISRLRRP